RSCSTRLLAVTASSDKGSAEAASFEGVEQRAGFEQAAAFLRSERERISSVAKSLAVLVNNQLRTDFRCVTIAKLDHLGKFVAGVDMQQGEWNLSRVEGFLGPAQHEGGDLSTVIQHHET